jgi:hypothetical protein
MSSFGTGSDGELVFTTSDKSFGTMSSPGDYTYSGNTLYLNPNREYNFTNMTIGTGTIVTLSSSATVGAVLYIKCTGTATIQGSIMINGGSTNFTLGSGGSNTWNSITGPNVEYGGRGGAGGGTDGGPGGGESQLVIYNRGFGTPGGGGACRNTNSTGGHGGIGGTYANGGTGGYAHRTSNGTSAAGGDWGGGMNGGGGGATAYLNSSSTGKWATSYGGNGFSPYDGSGTRDAVTGTAWYASAGGGGRGGQSGRQGCHFYLYALRIIFSGIINTSGSNGENGTNGGNAQASKLGTDDLLYCSAGGGGAGGGGGGGNAGNIKFFYGTITDTGTKTMSGGAKGLGGTGGSGDRYSPTGAVPYDGSNGADGTNGTAGAFSGEQLTLGSYINVGSNWKEIAEAYINIGGTWKSINGLNVNISSTWKVSL